MLGSDRRDVVRAWMAGLVGCRAARLWLAAGVLVTVTIVFVATGMVAPGSDRNQVRGIRPVASTRATLTSTDGPSGGRAGASGAFSVKRFATGDRGAGRSVAKRGARASRPRVGGHSRRGGQRRFARLPGALTAVSLVSSGSGWATVSREDRVVIPRQLASGVLLVAAGASLTPVDVAGAALSGAAHLDGSTAVTFADTGRSSDTVVRPLEGGVDVATVLRSAASPSRLFYRVGVPAGGSLVPRPGTTGAFDVLDRAGRAVAMVSPPVARDARGAPVALRVVREHHTLAVTVGPVGRGIVYPITVDPQLLDTSLTVSLSGSLYPTSAGQYAPQLIGDTPLQLSVTVGQSAGDPPPDQVLIQVDGGSPVPQGTISSGGTLCPAPPTSCLSGTAYWTFYPEQYGAGAHTITVTADDWADPQGFSAPTTFNVYVNHSAQASVGAGSVNLTTGELSLGATDVSQSGSGNDLTVERSYRSRDSSTGPLGPGWGLSVPAGQAGGDFSSLQPQPNGNVLATESSGLQDTFTADTNGDGGFTSPPGFAGVQLSQTSNADGQISEYPTPTSASQPWGITTGPDGAVWFTEEAANKIGRIMPSSYADSSGNRYTAGSYGVVSKTRPARPACRTRTAQNSLVAARSCRHRHR